MRHPSIDLQAVGARKPTGAPRRTAVQIESFDAALIRILEPMSAPALIVDRALAATSAPYEFGDLFSRLWAQVSHGAASDQDNMSAFSAATASIHTEPCETQHIRPNGLDALAVTGSSRVLRSQTSTKGATP